MSENKNSENQAEKSDNNQSTGGINPNSKMEIILFKNEILTDIKKTEKILVDRYSKINETIEEKLARYDKKIQELNEKYQELPKKSDENIMNETINKMLSFQDLTKDNQITTDVKIGNLEKDMYNNVSRIDKILADSVIYPGVIGGISKFKTFHEFMDYLLAQASQNITFRDKSTLDLKSYKIKLESLIKTFKSQFENIMKEIHSFTRKSVSECEDRIKLLLDRVDERIKETRVENATFMFDFQKTIDDLNKELVKMGELKNELYKKFDDKVDEIKEDNKNVLENFGNYKREFYIVKDRITQLAGFIKDIRFRTNIGKKVRRGEFYSMAKKLDFNKEQKLKDMKYAESDEIFKDNWLTPKEQLKKAALYESGLKKYIKGEIDVSEINILTFKDKRRPSRLERRENNLKNDIQMINQNNDEIKNEEKEKKSKKINKKEKNQIKNKNSNKLKKKEENKEEEEEEEEEEYEEEEDYEEEEEFEEEEYEEESNQNMSYDYIKNLLDEDDENDEEENDKDEIINEKIKSRIGLTKIKLKPRENSAKNKNKKEISKRFPEMGFEIKENKKENKIRIKNKIENEKYYKQNKNELVDEKKNNKKTRNQKSDKKVQKSNNHHIKNKPYPEYANNNNTYSQKIEKYSYNDNVIKEEEENYSNYSNRGENYENSNKKRKINKNSYNKINIDKKKIHNYKDSNISPKNNPLKKDENINNKEKESNNKDYKNEIKNENLLNKNINNNNESYHQMDKNYKNKDDNRIIDNNNNNINYNSGNHYEPIRIKQKNENKTSYISSGNQAYNEYGNHQFNDNDNNFNEKDNNMNYEKNNNQFYNNEDNKFNNSNGYNIEKFHHYQMNNKNNEYNDNNYQKNNNGLDDMNNNINNYNIISKNNKGLIRNYNNNNMTNNLNNSFENKNNLYAKDINPINNDKINSNKNNHYRSSSIDSYPKSKPSSNTFKNIYYNDNNYKNNYGLDDSAHFNGKNKILNPNKSTILKYYKEYNLLNNNSNINQRLNSNTMFNFTKNASSLNLFSNTKKNFNIEEQNSFINNSFKNEDIPKLNPNFSTIDISRKQGKSIFGSSTNFNNNSPSNLKINQNKNVIFPKQINNRNYQGNKNTLFKNYDNNLNINEKVISSPFQIYQTYQKDKKGNNINNQSLKTGKRILFDLNKDKKDKKNSFGVQNNLYNIKENEAQLLQNLVINLQNNIPEYDKHFINENDVKYMKNKAYGKNNKI